MPIKLLSFLSRMSRGTVILAVVFGIFSGLCSTSLLALISAILSRDGFSAPRLAAAFVALCLAIPLSKITSDYLLSRLGQRAVFSMRMELSRRILASPLRRLEEIGAHRILAMLTNDIHTIIDALVMVPIVCVNIAVITGCLIYLGWLSTTVLLMVLCFIAVGVTIFRLPVKLGSRHQALVREGADALFHHFQALTGGTKELKLHRRRRERFLSAVLRPTAEALVGHNVTAGVYFTAAASVGQFLFFIFIGLVLFVLPGVEEISAEVMTGTVITVLYMMSPMNLLMNTLASLSRANISLEKIEKLGLSLAESAAEPEWDAGPPAEPEWEFLELSGITHTYHREKENSSFVLGPIDLTVTRGELIFLIGGNGSGKTTLLKLISGLYAPESGDIRLNGRPVTDETRESYRQLFSVVFSDYYLFDSLLGVEAPRLDDEARNYLVQFQLNHKVEVKDGALSTLDLSQGQRKRLALLVAYLENRPVYIFDEWAADQDPLFKDIFYYQILPELKARGKTVIVISHDDHYYDVADRIVKLENGQLEYDRVAALTGEKRVQKSLNY
jgi:putative ATP-binding cassette transporter